MAKPTVKEVLFNPVFANNPIGLQILGICSALAVTSKDRSPLFPDVPAIAETYPDYVIIAFSCFADPVGRGSTSSIIPLVNSLADPTCDDFREGGDQKRDHLAVQVTPRRLTMQEQHRRRIGRAFIQIMHAQLTTVVVIDHQVMGGEGVAWQVIEAAVWGAKDVHK